MVAKLLPQVFEWARSVDPVQPLTSGVWQGNWAAGRRSAIASIQLDHLGCHHSFHSYGTPDEFDARIDELAPLGRLMICTEYLAREEGSTVEGILPIAKKRGVGVYNWGFIAGRTQTYLPWDSWDEPHKEAPKTWFHDLIQPDGRAYRPSEIATIQKLTAKAPPA